MQLEHRGKRCTQHCLTLTAPWRRPRACRPSFWCSATARTLDWGHASWADSRDTQPAWPARTDPPSCSSYTAACTAAKWTATHLHVHAEHVILDKKTVLQTLATLCYAILHVHVYFMVCYMYVHLLILWSFQGLVEPAWTVITGQCLERYGVFICTLCVAMFSKHVEQNTWKETQCLNRGSWPKAYNFSIYTECIKAARKDNKYRIILRIWKA